jgi:hypothetical protein
MFRGLPETASLPFGQSRQKLSDLIPISPSTQISSLRIRRTHFFLSRTFSPTSNVDGDYRG